MSEAPGQELVPVTCSQLVDEQSVTGFHLAARDAGSTAYLWALEGEKNGAWSTHGSLLSLTSLSSPVRL